MRYFGTITGRLINKHKQKVYQVGEEPEYWDAYFAELVNVTDSSGNMYGRVLVKATQKTALDLKEYIVPNNNISFDCREIKDNIVIGIRNVCPTLVGLGFNPPYDVVNFSEYYKRFDNCLACIDCKYRNKKSDCLKNCVPERR